MGGCQKYFELVPARLSSNYRKKQLPTCMIERALSIVLHLLSELLLGFSDPGPR